MAIVSMKNLLESGVHFGHQAHKWDPRMKPYIFAKRNGVHIIDLQKTIYCIREAYSATRKVVLSKKSILFVGTKKQARQAIEREAKNCGMFYVNNRWLGGTLTNFATIKQSLLRLKKLEKMEIDGTFDLMSKKEVSKLLKEKERLQHNQGGIKNMKELPGLVFIVDTNKEAIAVREAKSLNIPIVAVVDTNCNPEPIDYPIPGNDDAIRATSLFTQIIANAVIEADNKMGSEIIQKELYQLPQSLETDTETNFLNQELNLSLIPAAKEDDFDVDQKADATTDPQTNRYPHQKAHQDANDRLHTSGNVNVGGTKVAPQSTSPTSRHTPEAGPKADHPKDQAKDQAKGVPLKTSASPEDRTKDTAKGAAKTPVKAQDRDANHSRASATTNAGTNAGSTKAAPQSTSTTSRSTSHTPEAGPKADHPKDQAKDQAKGVPLKTSESPKDTPKVAPATKERDEEKK